MTKEAFIKQEADKIINAGICNDGGVTADSDREILIGFIEEIYDAGFNKGYSQAERESRPMVGTAECPDW